MKKILSLTVMFLGLTTVFTGTAFAMQDGIIASDVKYVDDYTLVGPVNYTEIEPADKSANIHVIVEIPSGTTAKWEVSPDTGNIVWEFKKGKPRTVDYKGGYPVNYGTVPKTLLSKELGGEGESVDVILFGGQQKRGAVVKARLIGVMRIKEGDGAHDDKLLAVAKGTPEYNVKSVDELNGKFNNIGNEVVTWFTNYKGPDSGMTFLGIGSAGEARRLFYSTLRSFKENEQNQLLVKTNKVVQQ